MSFREYAEKVLNEEMVSSKLIKNAIDILHDYVYYVNADLSKDERKEIIDNLEVTVDSIKGNSVTLNGVAEFIKNNKVSKSASFSIELKFNGVEDGVEDGDVGDMDVGDMSDDIGGDDELDFGDEGDEGDDVPEDMDDEDVPPVEDDEEELPESFGKFNLANLLEARKTNQKDYKYWVVSDGKINAGNEFKEDAQDVMNDFKESGLSAKVYTLQGLKKLGLDPDKNGDWGNPKFKKK